MMSFKKVDVINLKSGDILALHKLTQYADGYADAYYTVKTDLYPEISRDTSYATLLDTKSIVHEVGDVLRLPIFTMEFGEIDVCFLDIKEQFLMALVLS